MSDDDTGARDKVVGKVSSGLIGGKGHVFVIPI